MNLSQGYLLFLAAVLVAIGVAMMLPFLQYFLVAFLLAFMLLPVHRKLAPRVGRTASSALLMVAVTIALIVPFVVVIAAVAGDALRLARQLQEGELGLGTVETAIREYTGVEVDLSELLGSSLQNVGELLAGQAPGVFGAITHLLVGVGLVIFLLFFLLRDGDKLGRWIRTITPLPDQVQDELYGNVSNITSAVLRGHIVVAIIQGSIAGLGLLAVGIPNAVFWTFLMIIMSLLPAIGAFLIWGPAAAYLVYVGDVVPGVALFVYGAIVVGLTDEFLRPIIVDRHAHVNPSIILIGIIGGIYLFGFMGLFVGPILLGATKVTLEVLDEHYHGLDPT